MSWTQLVISIITILISGVSAYLGAKRGKTAAFRQALYAKQMEAVSELSVATYKVFTSKSFEDSSSALNDLRFVWMKWCAYLPNDVDHALIAFTTAARNVNDQKMRERDLTSWDREKGSTIYNRQFYAYIDVEQSFRKLIGVEPLSRETRALFRNT
jgi:hypothetical protein